MSCNCLNRDLVEKEIYKNLERLLDSKNPHNVQYTCETLLMLLESLGFDVDKKLIEHVCKGDYEDALILIKRKL
ncbi:hypothetical protein KY334_02185 [Candidatus Woesearchaeota archaeon]|nr:hypothetical protein [Candidatus Woesearchaeota archaeon]